MRGVIATGIAGLALLTAAGPAAAQGFGQVPFGTAPPDAPAPGAATKASTKPAGHEVEGVTVTRGRRHIPDSEKDPNEVLCHEELPMGSRFKVKICATRRQYAERRQFDQEQLREWTALRPYKGN